MVTDQSHRSSSGLTDECTHGGWTLALGPSIVLVWLRGLGVNARLCAAVVEIGSLSAKGERDAVSGGGDALITKDFVSGGVAQQKATIDSPV